MAMTAITKGKAVWPVRLGIKRKLLLGAGCMFLLAACARVLGFADLQDPLRPDAGVSSSSGGSSSSSSGSSSGQFPLDLVVDDICGESKGESVASLPAGRGSEIFRVDTVEVIQGGRNMDGVDTQEDAASRTCSHPEGILNRDQDGGIDNGLGQAIFAGAFAGAFSGALTDGILGFRVLFRGFSEDAPKSAAFVDLAAGLPADGGTDDASTTFNVHPLGRVPIVYTPRSFRASGTIGLTLLVPTDDKRKLNRFQIKSALITGCFLNANEDSGVADGSAVKKSAVVLLTGAVSYEDWLRGIGFAASSQGTWFCRQQAWDNARQEICKAGDIHLNSDDEITKEPQRPCNAISITMRLRGHLEDESRFQESDAPPPLIDAAACEEASSCNTR
jgi:hypothetical protein